MLFSFSTDNGFKLYQIDAKLIFLNKFVKEEVYIDQPSNFEHK